MSDYATVAQVRRAVQRLIDAHIAESWSGAKAPEDQPAIERELEKATEHFEKTLDALNKELAI